MIQSKKGNQTWESLLKNKSKNNFRLCKRIDITDSLVTYRHIMHTNVGSHDVMPNNRI